MLFISYNLLWSLNFFFVYVYFLIIASIIIYLLPSIKTLINYSKLKSISNFEYLTGYDVYLVLLTFLFLFFIINFSWCSFSISSWFGHLIFSSFQNKIIYLIFFFFFLVLNLYSTIFYFSSKEIYDYIVVNFNFFFWVLFLFLSNTIFTVIFFIEILSTLIFLIIITSTFSSTYFYNNLNLNIHNYFNNSTPFFFVQTLLYFFWISLISSLNLFLSLILFYIKFLTFDWFFFEYIFFYLINSSSLKDLFFFMFIWLNFLFCVFLKCGLVPFYFWKPVFFKGTPLHVLFFYIFFFYFFIFLFFLTFFLIYVNEIFFFFLNINIILLLMGFFILLSILCETYYLKSFLAISSILNTLFVFLALNGTNFLDFFF